MITLGVNIDHVATLRNARGGLVPEPVEAALIAEEFGADGITAHLREDRRHIRDEDMVRLKAEISTRLNMEMAATDEMVAIACELKPYMCTLVPERREERTTEGGLDVAGQEDQLKHHVAKLTRAGIPVSLFIEPAPAQIEAACRVGAGWIELHTGEYAERFDEGAAIRTYLLKQLIESANYAHSLNLRVNAGHGLTYDNIDPILQIPHLEELNIGHNIICRAVFTGLGPAVAEMKKRLSSERLPQQAQ